MSKKVFNVLDFLAEPELELDSISFTVGDSKKHIFKSSLLDEEDFLLSEKELRIPIFIKKGFFELAEFLHSVSKNNTLRFSIVLTNYVSSTCEINFQGKYSNFEIKGNTALLMFEGSYISNGYTSRSFETYFEDPEEHSQK